MIFAISVLEFMTLVFAVISMHKLMDAENSKEQKIMILMIVLGTIQNIGVFLEVNSVSLESAVNANKIEYAGSSFYALLLFHFVSTHCNRKIHKSIFGLMITLCCVSVLSVWTDDITHLYYSSNEFSYIGRPHMEVVHGPLFIFYILALVVPYFPAVVMLYEEAKAETELHRKQTLYCILLLSIFPFISFGLHIVAPKGGFDVTPLVTLWVAILSVYLLNQIQGFDVVRMAADRVLDVMDDAVITTDSKMQVLFANDAAIAIFPELENLNHEVLINQVKNFPKEVFTMAGKNEFALNDRYFESHVNIVRDKFDVARGYTIIIFDVSEMHQHMDEMEKMKDAADSANRAKSEFLAMMSHEIRTPMNAITGLSELIIEESIGRKVYDFAVDIKEASNSLLGIINNILDISKIEAGKMEITEVDYEIGRLQKEVSGMLKLVAAEHGLVLKSNIDENIPYLLHGDEGKIRQIMINIINNAIKFTKQGYVSITTYYDRLDEFNLNLYIKIEDTGIGIKEEDKGRIFDNFQQVDTKKNRKVEGSGLGLSICKDLAKLMKGDIRLESEYGKGSVFTVRIPQQIVEQVPLKDAGDIIRAKEEETNYMFICPKCRFLIVDDNRINLKVAVGFLEVYGAKLDQAKSGPEAIELVKQNKYDIIFMDHMMPDMDGVEATRIIRKDCGENGTSPVIIALTANAIKGAREMFLTNGFEDFLAKPIDKNMLHEIMIKYVPDELKVESTEEVSDSTYTKEDVEKLAMEGVDVEKGLSLRKKGVDDYLELLYLYYTDGLGKSPLIEQLAKEERYREYEIEVHALKSASANIGAEELSALAKSHEFAAKDMKVDFIKENLDNLIKSYNQVLGEVERVLISSGKVGNKQKANDNLKQIDEENLRHMIEEALTCLEDFKPKDCARLVERILGYQMEQETRKVLENVKTKLKLYDDDTAEDLLRELVDVLYL